MRVAYPRIIPVFVFHRRARGWLIAWRDPQHRACEPGCRCRNAQGLHSVLAGRTKEEAQRMAQWVRDRLMPWNAPQTGVEWRFFVAQYMLAIANRSPAHRLIADRVINKFTATIRPQRSGTVSATHVDCYLSELKDDDGGSASQTERAKHWRYLHALFRWGVKRGLCLKNPVAETLRPHVEETLVHAPGWTDVLTLLRTCSAITCNDAQGLYLLILLAVITGLRASDLLALRLEDYQPAGRDLPAGLWYARNRKGHKVKACGLPAKVERLLSRRIKALPAHARTLFFWPSFPHNAWDRLRKQARAEALQFQALRRAAGALSAASAMRAAASQHLQHSTAEVYIRHYEDRVQTALAYALALPVPALPKLPRFSLGTLDHAGRRRAVTPPADE